MPTRMFRTGAYATGAVLMALLLAGCPSNDVDGADLADALEEAGATSDQADCAAERFDDLNQDDRNEIAEADDQEAIDDLPENLRTDYEAIMTECLAEGGGDTSSTTAAEGEETSSTTAPAGDSTTTTAAE
jgi:hypothetical protein